MSSSGRSKRLSFVQQDGSSERPPHGDRRYSNYGSEKQPQNVVDDMPEVEQDDVPMEEDRYEGRKLYSVKWKGWTKETWEPIENLDGCEEKLTKFYQVMRGTDLDDKNLDKRSAYLAAFWISQQQSEPHILREYKSSKTLDVEAYDRYVLKKGKSKSERGEGSPEIAAVPFVDFSTIKSKLRDFY
ncbi:13389_t:CDS:2 [Ambispora gerdemannii]|uniref:13389_t:CDS:1 n=1 Tax=Ambispora gerdemannii TaxID=144530 RepID=A0A9N9FCK4_9GLOM|nr:13389_t:CDS:2 [Ambispora gerdemannii]